LAITVTNAAASSADEGADSARLAKLVPTEPVVDFVDSAINRERLPVEGKHLRYEWQAA